MASSRSAPSPKSNPCLYCPPDATLFHRSRAELALRRNELQCKRFIGGRRDMGTLVMAIQNLTWSNIHASAYRQADGMLTWAQAPPRPHGALRYRCPVTG